MRGAWVSSVDEPRLAHRLLAALPAEDFRRILPDLETIPLTAKQVLLKRGDPIRYVFFTNEGVCSVTSMMKNGAAVEVATVGDEGMVGIAAFFGGYTMPGESMVQVSDPRSAERMRVEAFRREVERRGALHNGISRYSHGTMALMVQSTACMALHHVTERCCRWLLWRRADKHRGIVLRDDFRPSFGKEERPKAVAVAKRGKAAWSRVEDVLAERQLEKELRDIFEDD